MGFLAKAGVGVAGALVVVGLASVGGHISGRGPREQTPEEWADAILTRHDHDSDGIIDLTTVAERFGKTERNAFSDLLGKLSNEELPALVGVQLLTKKDHVQKKHLVSYATKVLDSDHDGAISREERMAVVPKNFKFVEANTWGSVGPLDRAKLELKYGEDIKGWVDGLRDKRFD